MFFLHQQVLMLFVRKHSSVLTVASGEDDGHPPMVDGDADIDRVYLALRVLRVCDSSHQMCAPPFSTSRCSLVLACMHL